MGGGGSGAAELADELEEIISRREGTPGPPLIAIFSLDGVDAELRSAAMRQGPEAGVYVIRCLLPGDGGEGPSLSGAAVSFGGAAGSDRCSSIRCSCAATRRPAGARAPSSRAPTLRCPGRPKVRLPDRRIPRGRRAVGAA